MCCEVNSINKAMTILLLEYNYEMFSLYSLYITNICNEYKNKNKNKNKNICFSEINSIDILYTKVQKIVTGVCFNTKFSLLIPLSLVIQVRHSSFFIAHHKILVLQIIF